MNFTKIRRITALALLVSLLLATTCVGFLFESIGSRDNQDWIHAFCLTQTMLIAAVAVYGPGRFIVRMPLAIAWGLAIGFVLATNNLITLPGRASLAAGTILVVAGTLPPLILFALHRWRTGVRLVFGNPMTGRTAARRAHQLSLQMLFILTAAFALTGVAARVAITAPPDPYATEHDSFVLHGWLGFFPCLAVAPALLVVFRPSWKVVLAFGFFVCLTLSEPLLFAIAGPFIFIDKSIFTPMNLDLSDFRAEASLSFIWHGQALTTVVIYALLARAAGFRMVVPAQSNDKKPNPSAQPATDAGCVQD